MFPADVGQHRPGLLLPWEREFREDIPAITERSVLNIFSFHCWKEKFFGDSFLLLEMFGNIFTDMK